MAKTSYDLNQAKSQTDPEKEEAEEYCKQLEQKRAARSNWETHWQEALDYIVPRKSDITTSVNPGTKKGNELFDTTAIMANQLLAGALHSMLTNPTTRFFDLIPGDPSFVDDEQVKNWLQDCGDRMFQVITNSNFQTEVHEIYLDEGAIGTACLYMGEHDERIIHFSARSMKEIFIDENNEGLVDTVYRVFKWKPRQIIQEFGEQSVPREILQKSNEGSQDDFEIIHCTHPYSDEEYKQRGEVYKFKSAYILKEMGFFLSHKGYHEFPYAVPRWTKTSGEIYGRGPGMDMLPDIKMVNRMMETTLKGAQKTVDPPLMVSDDGVIGNVRLTPGGLTVIRPTSEVPIKPLIIDARIDFGLQIVEGVRQRIRSGFYVDQLQLQEGPQMTATEVNQRTEEKARLMGPVLGRQHFEFLRPLIDRLFGVMARRKLLPQAPQKLRGKMIDVRYSSLLARAQRAQEGQALMRAISMAAPIVQAKPAALDNLDEDMAFNYIMDMNGVPHKIMREQRGIKSIRDSRAQAQQQMLQQQQEQHSAEVAGKTLPGAAQIMQAQKQ